MGACCESKPFGKPCGDCAFDEPVAAQAHEHFDGTRPAQETGCSCPGCQGLIDPESGLLRTLEFASAMAPNVAASGARGRIAAIKHLFDGAMAPPGMEAAGSAMNDFLGSLLEDPVIEGDPFSPVHPWLLWKVSRMLWPTRPLLPFGTPDEDLVGKGRCGVERFEYPKRWEEVKEAGMFDTGEKTFPAWFMGIRFWAEVEYKNDRVVYFCECCEFKQFAAAEGFSEWQSKKHPFKTPDEGAPYEDTGSESDGTRGAQEGKAGNPPHRNFGGARDWGDTLPFKGAKEEYYKNETTACLVKIIDTPGVLVNPGGSYEQHQEFTGRVYDICNNDAVVDTRKFGFKMAGTAPAADGSADSSESGTATVVSYDGASPQIATHSVAEDGTKKRLP